MHYPVDKKYRITYGFGQINHNIYYVFDGRHPGVDIALKKGTNIYSTLPGWVYRREFHRGMGRIIGIRYGNIQHIYGHMDKICVDYGDWIEEGQQIGLSGDTCMATVPHLHFELRDRSVFELKNRPIKPDFNLNIPKEFCKSFHYFTDGNEALIDIALKFFGSELGVYTLKTTNTCLKNIDTDYVSMRKPLTKNLDLLIPLK